MFSRLALLSALSASALLAAATGTVTTTVTVTSTAPGTTETVYQNQCSTGPVQCCNSVKRADSAEATTILGLLGIALSDLNVLVGLQCSPVTVGGIGGNSCNAQTVCCQNNDFSGVIVIGCVPINISL
ncbi:fungal hydrophobin-domain-containing protein [Crucibulum laeve]|uniref:Hydrophobin n=1 Tax=Crucibulum laeve TaxID=68775 RepID=A0A5C3LWE9_9AGAR|nr:fungal hydrophobin-domain-containing protein [Crucibulum laeve]